MSDLSLHDMAAIDAAGAMDDRERPVYLARLARASAAERQDIAAIYETAAAAFAVQSNGDSPSPHTREQLLRRAEGTGDTFTVRKHDMPWERMGVPGLEVRTLSVDRERHTATLHVRFTAGAVYPAHQHSGPEDCYVLSGEILVQGQHLSSGDYHHAAAGSRHDPLVAITAGEVLLVVAADDYLRP